MERASTQWAVTLPRSQGRGQRARPGHAIMEDREKKEVMMDVVATFRVEYTQFLNPQGDASKSLPEFARDPEALLPLYRAMVRTRLFDAKAITLQRTGNLGTFASSLGQEAIGVGVASAISHISLAACASIWAPPSCPPGLDQHIKNFALGIHGAPEVDQRYYRSTTTFVPTFARSKRSTTSWLVIRMQPDDTAAPIVSGSFEP